ncbi:MAG: hypothetical protein Q9220_004933 [cf. Caloplaca sp. 1 TL-2023]
MSCFEVQPLNRFATGSSSSIRRPKEIAFFSYDDAHDFHLDDQSLRYYYPPQIGADLSKGFDTFQQLDDSIDDHLDSLLRTVIDLERRNGSICQADVITWRGMMTKIMAVPFDLFNGSVSPCVPWASPSQVVASSGLTGADEQLQGFIEENHVHKLESREAQHRQPPHPGSASQDMMSYWGTFFDPDLVPAGLVLISLSLLLKYPFLGYKFETLSLLPTPWAETSRDYIETRESLNVNNHAQYCSIVKTGIGGSRLVLGGEVDALWDSKPTRPDDPINWVELKTAATPLSDRDVLKYERKLLKFWIQSFLLGVPKIIVGFRNREGILQSLEELETSQIPRLVKQKGKSSWDGNVCINFTAAFLEWLKMTINTDGVWRIRKREKAPTIEVLRIQESGHGDILSKEFVDWRTRLEEKS